MKITDEAVQRAAEGFRFLKIKLGFGFGFGVEVDRGALERYRA